MATIIPPCKWAQRKERIYITVEVTDASAVKVTFDTKKTTFSGNLGEDKKFDHTFNLFGEIVPEESSYKLLGRELQINLKRKDVDAGYWDRLTEEPSKVSKTFLTCDWDRWVDEDEDNGEDEDFGYGDLGGMDYGGPDSDDESDAPLDDMKPDENEPTA